MHYTKTIRSAVRRKWHTPELKEWWYTKLSSARRRKVAKLFALQNGKCVFCNEDTWLCEETRGDLPKRKFATLEHVKPQSKGGTDSMKNLAMSCHACNHLRGDMCFNKFMTLRQSPEKWSNFCKMKRRVKQDKVKKTKEADLPKIMAVVYRLAVLFYCQPKYNEAASAIIDSIQARRERLNEKRRKALEHDPVNPGDILVDTPATNVMLAA